MNEWKNARRDGQPKIAGWFRVRLFASAPSEVDVLWYSPEYKRWSNGFQPVEWQLTTRSLKR